MEIFNNFIDKNGLVVGFLVIGIIAFLSEVFSKKVLRGYLPGSAIAILAGLILAYFGGVFTGGEKGLADIVVFKGVGTFGGSMFRDFTIVATAMGASYLTMKKAGWLGLVSLLFGIVFFFVFGVALALIWGVRDAASLCTIGAGSCTYIVGPVTGAALGASSDIIALSIAIGVLKAILVTILTPLLAKRVGLTNPAAAMAFGGLMGTNSGVSAGLAATDPALVPYGAVTATFYTGLGCLLCPSLFYLMLGWVL
ncbi:malonate transporter subunit MadM [Lacihabitans sp. CCS-44]|uniref:malonate transporter subunit MadM n=1 Tax=Lacihabitans sp. CCS-44 TaxID=2487331 RepID=UPI0020CECAB4|nr:malonate transporter subunit MadM [Lacihabitans sp. CCS-44]MCP9755612.1 malonate transporter subunit MadM [Lacihabitans sp. CCS-44]